MPVPPGESQRHRQTLALVLVASQVPGLVFSPAKVTGSEMAVQINIATDARETPPRHPSRELGNRNASHFWLSRLPPVPCCLPVLIPQTEVAVPGRPVSWQSVSCALVSVASTLKVLTSRRITPVVVVTKLGPEDPLQFTSLS